MNNRLQQALRRIGSRVKTPVALVAFGSCVVGAVEVKEYYDLFPRTTTTTTNDNDEIMPKKKKKVLCLPFHKMKILEEKKSSPFLMTLQQSLDTMNNDDGTIIEVGIRELVDTIHAAAEDPNIVALYGTFTSSRLECGGHAHVEEIRNAIRVFNESSSSSSSSYDDTTTTTTDIDTAENAKEEDDKPRRQKNKVSYAFSDTFENSNGMGNKEYFLASAFSQVYLQPRGNLNLFGVHLSSLFLHDFLHMNGIKVNVFQHGKYKNAPNTFSTSGYTRAHRENTQAIVDSLNHSIHASIAETRKLPKVYNKSMWKGIHNYGTLTADNAKEIKLVDRLPNIDPLMDLVKMNKKEKDDDNDKSNLVEKWDKVLGKQHGFEANECISLAKYSSRLKMMNKWKKRKIFWYNKLKQATARSSATTSLLKGLGCEAPYFGFDQREVDDIYSKANDEQIAIVHVSGAISDGLSAKVVRSLREIKYNKNVKGVVLRIDSPGGAVVPSEMILEECKELPQPVVCSFSNLAASGGYYVAMSASKIFALPTTLTGSIGVYGIRFDASEAAKKYGIGVDSITSGDHGTMNNMFQPLTKKNKMNQNRNIDRVYLYFKQLVSKGRQMSLTDVESVAQGRVWTGQQAKEVGLCDELGGLEQAISFCKKEFTTTGYADVLVYPKPKPILQRLLESKFGGVNNNNHHGDDEKFDLIQSLIKGVVFDDSSSSYSRGVNESENILLCMDEESAIQASIRKAVQQIYNK